MQPSKLIYTTLFLVLLIAGRANTAFAGVPAVHIAPKPNWIGTPQAYTKRPPNRNIENGYFYALNERQIDVDRKAEYFHVIREIVSQTGVQNGSQIAVSFDPSYERLDFHQITIWRDGKPQNRLNPADFKVLADEEDFSKFIYQGSYSANYIIPDIRKGDRIEYAYTITGRNPVFGNHFCEDIYLQGYQAIAHQYVSVQFNIRHNLYMKTFNHVPQPEITESNGTKRYVWESFQVQPIIDYDDNAPAWYNTRTRMQISEFATWGDVVNWALSVNPIPTDIKGELAERIAKLKTEAAGDQEKYFREAVKTVQDEVRYMGIEIGEYSHRANRPEKVFAQRYGDCKDKALLLVSMLRADGIDADMVLVNTDQENRISEFIPTSDAFNHAVVVAQLKGKPVWIDATISYQRGKGANLYFPNYGKGLQLKPGTNALVNIPLTQTGKQISREKYTVTGSGDKVRLDVTTVYTLNQADDMRSRLSESGVGSTERNYLKYYAKMYPQIEPRDTLIIKDNEQKNELTTVESYLIPGFFKRDSIPGKLNAGFYADPVDRDLPDLSAISRAPVTVNYPANTDYTIEVVLPGGWNVPASNSEISRNAYQFASDYSVKGNSLLLHYQFKYLQDYVPADELIQFKNDIKQLRNNELSFNFSYRPGDVQAVPDGGAAYNYNPWMITLVILVLGGCLFAAVWVYRQETPGIVFEMGASFTPIGGWLILVLLALSVTPMVFMDVLFKEGGYFNADTWTKFAADPIKDTSWHAMLIWEAIGNSIILCYSIFCLVLLLNKRDILPRAITGFIVAGVIFSVVDLLLAVSINQNLTDNALGLVILSLTGAGIWIPYFRRSTRVEQTFIVPYPHHNFSYERSK